MQNAMVYFTPILSFLYPRSRVSYIRKRLYGRVGKKVGKTENRVIPFLMKLFG